MVWYKRLRWRLISIQMLVVVIGISSVLLATRVLLLNALPDAIRPNLQPYIDSPTAIATIEREIFAAFSRTITISLTVAGIGAIIAGVIASILLWRTIVLPLRKIASSSERIAAGHYDERVPVSDQSGEAMQQVVTNFNNMASRLQTTEENRVTMVGDVAHELRTPLTGLRGVVEGLEDGIYTPNSETFQRLSNELERLARLVNDLQDLSRAEAGATRLNLHDFVMCDVVRSVLSHLKAQADSKGVDLVAHEVEPPMSTYADSDRTAQVLTNLISNAIRYTPAGGAITVQLTRLDDRARVAVIDTGVGISAENIPHLFDRFYRVDASRSRQSGGSGVGLTIARHLTWAMGGELSAESPGVNQGSTFTLTLPLSKQ